MVRGLLRAGIRKIRTAVRRRFFRETLQNRFKNTIAGRVRVVCKDGATAIRATPIEQAPTPSRHSVYSVRVAIQQRAD